MKVKSLWTEFYRPDNLDDLVLTPETRKLFSKYLEKNEIPNQIYTGTAGLGKTTTANMFVKLLNTESLYINGSKETSIDTVRETVTTFAFNRSL